MFCCKSVPLQPHRPSSLASPSVFVFVATCNRNVVTKAVLISLSGVILTFFVTLSLHSHCAL